MNLCEGKNCIFVCVCVRVRAFVYVRVRVLAKWVVWCAPVGKLQHLRHILDFVQPAVDGHAPVEVEGVCFLVLAFSAIRHSRSEGRDYIIAPLLALTRAPRHRDVKLVPARRRAAATDLGLSFAHIAYQTAGWLFHTLLFDMR